MVVMPKSNSYVEGTRARAAAARAILVGLKEAKNLAFRELAAIEREQNAATERVRLLLDKIDDDFEIPDDISADEEKRLFAQKDELETALGELDELASIVGDFAYELDITDPLKEIDDRIKLQLRILENANRAASKLGIKL